MGATQYNMLFFERFLTKKMCKSCHTYTTLVDKLSVYLKKLDIFAFLCSGNFPYFSKQRTLRTMFFEARDRVVADLDESHAYGSRLFSIAVSIRAFLFSRTTFDKTQEMLGLDALVHPDHHLPSMNAMTVRDSIYPTLELPCALPQTSKTSTR